MAGAALLEHVRAALERHARDVRTAVIAVSGGPDSVALLRACLALRDAGDAAAPAHVHVAHFDHRLREGSAEDAAFVARLADRLGLPCHAGGAPVASVSRAKGWNLAEGARHLRYAFLARTATEVGADAVFVAHTRDDQAETVLHQLVRGAAYAAGMAPRRGWLVRPLLEASRAEGIAYLRSLGEPFLEDPTNDDVRWLRAWLRHEVLAPLAARVPGASAALARHARVQRDVRAFVRDEARRRFGEAPLDAARLAAAPVALQREALAVLLAAHGASVDLGALERVRAQLGRSAPYRLDVGGGATVRIAYGHVDVVREPPAPVEPRPVTGPADLPAGAPPDLLRHGGPLVVRGRRPGDTIRLRGGTKKVAELLVDRKVPREVRDALPLVARGSEVLWIDGVAAADGVAVEPDPEDAAMARALDLARAAAAAGELPVGAVVLLDGDVVAEAHNEGERRGDPTAHAELLALRRAAERTGRHRLADATLVVTLEPCPMCFGAVLQAHVGRVVYGAANVRDGALGGVMDLTAAPWKRRVEVRGGVRARQAAELLSAFFAARR